MGFRLRIGGDGQDFPQPKPNRLSEPYKPRAQKPEVSIALNIKALRLHKRAAESLTLNPKALRPKRNSATSSGYSKYKELGMAAEAA